MQYQAHSNVLHFIFLNRSKTFLINFYRQKQKSICFDFFLKTWIFVRSVKHCGLTDTWWLSFRLSAKILRQASHWGFSAKVLFASDSWQVENAE